MEASFARSIISSTPMSIIGIDELGRIRLANDTARSFFAIGALENDPQVETILPGLDWRVLFGATGRSRRNLLPGALSAGEPVRALGRHGPRRVEVRASPFTAADEDFVTLFVQDIEDAARAEETLQELRLQLTYTWRLNSLGEMASMLAHELNQPLAAIRNFMHVARRHAADRPQAVQAIDMASDQTQRAGDVIRHMRDLVSGESRAHVAENLGGVVNDIIPMAQINVRESRAQLEFHVSDSIQLRCDRIQVQQLLLNLIRNAVEAPSTGLARRIIVYDEPTDTGGRLVVADNGPGLSPETRERMFKPMMSSKSGNMGLGLSISRTIAEAHDGSLDLVPSPLGGAAFAFSWPDSRMGRLDV